MPFEGAVYVVKPATESLGTRKKKLYFRQVSILALRYNCTVFLDTGRGEGRRGGSGKGYCPFLDFEI